MPSRRVPEELAATPEQVSAAVGSLTSYDRLQLERFARLRIARIGLAAEGRGYEDLLSDALLKTVSGERRWNTSVSFVTYLKGVVRSESSHWAEKYAAEMRSGRDRLGAEVAFGSSEDIDNSQERLLEVRQTLEAVRALFGDDALVSNILAGWEEGLSALEIQQVLGTDATTFESKVRAMRRALIKAGLKSAPVRSTR